MNGILSGIKKNYSCTIIKQIKIHFLISISSAPERSDYLWLHIRAVGNWTNKLHSYSMSTKFDLSFTSQNRSRQSNPGVIMRTTVMNRLNSNDIMEKNEHQQHVKVNFAFKNNSLENIDRDEVKVTNEMIKNEIELNEHKGLKFFN